jgi:hypothetical protein
MRAPAFWGKTDTTDRTNRTYLDQKLLRSVQKLPTCHTKLGQTGQTYRDELGHPALWGRLDEGLWGSGFAGVMGIAKCLTSELSGMSGHTSRYIHVCPLPPPLTCVHPCSHEHTHMIRGWNVRVCARYVARVRGCMAQALVQSHLPTSMPLPHYAHTMSTYGAHIGHIGLYMYTQAHICTHAHPRPPTPAQLTQAQRCPTCPTMSYLVHVRFVLTCHDLTRGLLNWLRGSGSESPYNSIISNCDLRHTTVENPWYYWDVGM